MNKNVHNRSRSLSASIHKIGKDAHTKSLHNFSQFLTLLLAICKTIPIGTKIIPITKNKGMTLLGVRSGCHDLSLCCLKAVSKV